MGDGGSNCAISGSNKSKMAAAAIIEKFQMAISPQQLTIYLYSAHRAVIFAIAQLSCCITKKGEIFVPHSVYVQSIVKLLLND